MMQFFFIECQIYNAQDYKIKHIWHKLSSEKLSRSQKHVLLFMKIIFMLDKHAMENTTCIEYERSISNLFSRYKEWSNNIFVLQIAYYKYKDMYLMDNPLFALFSFHISVVVMIWVIQMYNKRFYLHFYFQQRSRSAV